MAYFLRLIPTWAWFAVGCLLGGVPQFAFADTYPPTRTYGATVSGTSGGNGHSSPEAAAAAAGAAWDSTTEFSYAGACSALPKTPFSYANQSGSASWDVSYVAFGTTSCGQNWGDLTFQQTCPYGGSFSAGQCINAPACTAPQVRNPTTGQCENPPEPCQQNAGKWHSSGYGWRESKPWGPEAMSGTGEVPTTLCADNCAVTVTFDDVIRFPSKNTWSGVGYSQATGQSCQSTNPVPPAPTTGPTDPKTSPEYDCAKNGQSWGTVNGTVVCTGGTTDKETTKTDTSKTTNPDNTTSETQTTTQCQGTTCTETKTTTNCDANGENCTTSTTTTEKTGTGEGGEGEGDEAESKWGGNCAGGFSCSGDAIQCAIAKEQHTRNCELEPSQANKDKGQNVIDGVLEANDPRRPENKASEAFGNWSAEGGMSGSCPADFSVQLYGQTIVVPWSDLCPHFNAMGYAMLAVAWVIAASVLRGVL